MELAEQRETARVVCYQWPLPLSSRTVEEYSERGNSSKEEKGQNTFCTYHVLRSARHYRRMMHRRAGNETQRQQYALDRPETAGNGSTEHQHLASTAVRCILTTGARM